MDFEDRYYDRLDDLIFHFTSREIAFEHVLFSRTLKLGLRSSFDDIAESSRVRVTVKGRLDHEETKQESLAIGEKILRLQDFAINGLRATCFCAKSTSDFPGFVKSPRMWSQYADGQEGVCLVFSRSELEAEILGDTSDPQSYQFKNVEYKEYPMNHSIELSKSIVHCNSYESLHRQVFFEKFGHIFFEKNINYSDEMEFRVLYAGELQTQYLKVGKSLLSVVLGRGVSDAYAPAIEKYSRDGIVFYRNGYDSGHPRVERL